MKIADAVWVWSGKSWEKGNILEVSDDLVTVRWSDGQENSLQFMAVHLIDPCGQVPCNRCGKLGVQNKFNKSMLCVRCFGEHTN